MKYRNKNMNHSKKLLKTLAVAILTISLTMFSMTANAHHGPTRHHPPFGRPVPTMAHHRPHHHRHSAIPFFPIPAPIPIVVGSPITAIATYPCSGRIWIEGRWIEDVDAYGRIVGRRWIPGHWEYR